jgi:large subunit ribosomal protein L24
MSAKIKKGDLVRVVSGGQKGTVDTPTDGRVIRVQASKNRIWIEGVNIIHRHVRGVAGQTESEIVKKEAPLNISNVMLLDPETNQPTRVGFKEVFEISDEERKRLEGEGHKVKPRKVRFAKKSGAILDN